MLLRKILAMILLIAVITPALEARGGGRGGRGGFSRGGGRGRGGFGRGGYRHGGYGYGGWGYGGAVAGGVIAGTALGYAASRGYNDYEGEYTAYPVNYSNQTYVTQEPIDDPMDIE